MQESELGLIVRIRTVRGFHFPVVAELLLEVRHVGANAVKDVDFGRVGRLRSYADGGYGIRESFPVGAFGRNPFCAADAADGRHGPHFAEIE